MGHVPTPVTAVVGHVSTTSYKINSDITINITTSYITTERIASEISRYDNVINYDSANIGYQETIQDSFSSNNLQNNLYIKFQCSSPHICLGHLVRMMQDLVKSPVINGAYVIH